MRVLLYSLALFCAGFSPAWAQPPAVAGDDMIIEFCRTVVAHVPADDVHYRAGVDVHGKPVVPADVGGSQQVRAPDLITIDLTVPLRDLIAAAGPALVGGAEADLGQISVNRRNGEILYNGQILAGGLADELKQSCLRLHLR